MYVRVFVNALCVCLCVCRARTDAPHFRLIMLRHINFPRKQRARATHKHHHDGTASAHPKSAITSRQHNAPQTTHTFTHTQHPSNSCVNKQLHAHTQTTLHIIRKHTTTTTRARAPIKSTDIHIFPQRDQRRKCAQWCRDDDDDDEHRNTTQQRVK